MSLSSDFFFFFCNVKLERQLVGLNWSTHVQQLKQVCQHHLLILFFQTSWLKSSPSKGKFWIFFDGMITFCLCKQNLIFLSELYSTIQRMAFLSHHVVGIGVSVPTPCPVHCPRCWRWTSPSLMGGGATWLGSRCGGRGRGRFSDCVQQEVTVLNFN